MSRQVLTQSVSFLRGAKPLSPTDSLALLQQFGQEIDPDGSPTADGQVNYPSVGTVIPGASQESRTCSASRIATLAEETDRMGEDCAIHAYEFPEGSIGPFVKGLASVTQLKDGYDQSAWTTTFSVGFLEFVKMLFFLSNMPVPQSIDLLQRYIEPESPADSGPKQSSVELLGQLAFSVQSKRSGDEAQNAPANNSAQLIHIGTNISVPNPIAGSWVGSMVGAGQEAFVFQLDLVFSREQQPKLYVWLRQAEP